MKHLTKYTIILLASFLSIIGFAQTTVETIDLPLNGGTTIGDIIYANGKISAFISKKDGIARLEYDNSSYTYSLPLLDAESNFFRKGAVTTNKIFFNNTLANGMEIYNIGSGAFETTNIRTGYPVYQIAANEDGSNLYFYNKLNAHDIGFYTYEPSDGTTTRINIDAAIGDIIYNPYQDHFLVSKFEPASAKVAIFNASTNGWVADIDLGADIQFAKEMFISPNGHLYVCADMNYDSEQVDRPKVFIYDATSSNYSSVISEPLTVSSFKDLTHIYNELSAYYSAHFDYNPHDTSVYISMTIQDLKRLPYNSVASSIYQDEDGETIPPPPPIGKVLVVKDNAIDGFAIDINLEFFPGKVICPVPDGDIESSRYHGKLFIAGSKFYEYDWQNPPTSEDEITKHEHYFINMVYSPFHDKLFAVKESTLSCSEHRTFEIWTAVYNENLSFSKLEFIGPQYDGQIASMFYNPYDRRMYVYQKIDGEKLGTEEVKLLSFDPGLANPVWTATSLGISSYYPEYDHTRDVALYWFYNMTTPYINPSTNHIYLPNGGHSCVSKVSFDANEPLLLHRDEWAWLSFPRMERTGNTPVPVGDVLGGDNIVPGGYLQNSELQNLPLQSDQILFNIYNNIGIWSSQPGGLANIQSTLGYKLKLLYDPQPDKKWVLLSGEVLDPNTTFDLYNDKENWIGYYLYEEQDVFDALAGYIEDIEVIRHQDYYCYRPHGGDIIFGPEGGGVYPPEGPEWACNNSVHNIKYGDMIIVHPNRDIESFSWTNGGGSGDGTARPETTYYTYEETADYKPLIIELDSTENPEEIGAFVGDTCVGAASVIEADTAIILMAYLDGRSEDSVVFQEYSSAKSSGMKTITSYLVLNEERGLYEKRSISTREGNQRVFVSFKNRKVANNDESKFGFNIWPNPTSGSLFYSLLLNDVSFVSISIFDITGKPVAEPVSEMVQPGRFAGEMQLKSFSGEKLKPGIYLVKLKAGQWLETKKVIVK